LSGGLASGTVVSGGGSELVESGGTAAGSLVSGGFEFVLDGGNAFSTIVFSRGEERVSSGAATSGTVVSSGGLQTVLTGGLAGGARIGSGGTARIFGSATDTSVDTGGVGRVESGGTERVVNNADGVTISAAGQEIVQSGGTARLTVVGGGFEFVESGGRALSTLVLSSGEERVSAGGIANGAVISAGGVQTVLSGANASGTTLRGGLVEVQAGGAASGVTFEGSGTLQLDDSVHFSGTVGGFATPQDELDLRDVSFGSNTTLNYTQQAGSGTLRVSDGTNTANITLLGSHSQSDFTIAGDGFGGSLITDPPATDNGFLTAAAAGSPNATAQTVAVAPGDQTLTAGSGPEIFDFSSLGFGHDMIAGFASAQDAIGLPASLAGDFTTVQSDMSATAGGTLITLDPSHSIALGGVPPGSLTAANFRFA
jgi:autotransporter passenger strand-loop-strand repeat protein